MPGSCEDRSCTDQDDPDFYGPCYVWGYKCRRFPIYAGNDTPITDGVRCQHDAKVVRWVHVA